MQKLVPYAIALVVVLLLLVPFVLHFGQKRHNQLTIGYEKPEGADAGLVAGRSFGTGTAVIIEHELDSTTGWRPNDLIFWGPDLWADNNSNRQLGILQALRETVRVFKDHLTKVSSDVYDRNLVEADNLLRNDPEKWAFPSAESRYEEAAEKLRAYVAGLNPAAPSSRPINVRNMELIRLIHSWTDLLGDAHAELYRRRLSWWKTDDVFYRTTGYCHVMAQMVPAVEIEYHRELENRPVLAKLFEEVKAPLQRCALMKPLIVLDGGDTSVLANHRRNLDGYVTEARQKLYSIREELEK